MKLKRSIQPAKVLLFLILIGFTMYLNPQAIAQQSFQPEIYDKSKSDTKKGFRLFNFVLHPALGVYTSFDSNALYSKSTSQNDFVFEVIPGLDLNRDRSKFNVNLGYRYKLRKHLEFSVQDNHAHSLSFSSTYHLSHRLSFDLNDVLEKSADPATIEISQRLSRFENKAMTSLNYRSPGDDLTSKLGFEHRYLTYESDLPQLSFFNNQASQSSSINLSLNSRFKFLPKSSITGKFNYGFRDFKNSDPTQSPSVSDSVNYGVTLGLNTLITRRYGFLVNLGYNKIDFDFGPNASSMTGQFGFEYLPSSKSKMSIHFIRDVQTSSFTNYYKTDRISFDVSAHVFRKFRLMIKEELSFLNFSGPNLNPDGDQTRDDFVSQTMVRLLYDFKRYFSTYVDFQYIMRDSNSSDIVTNLGIADFDKMIVMLGFEIYY